MRESSTYQAILEEGAERGREEEARKLLLLLGRARLGEPTPAGRERLEHLQGVEQLEQLITRTLQVESWDELLGS